MSDISQGAYAIGARKYWEMDWSNPIPVHNGQGLPGKSHVPRGYTGFQGRGVSWPDLTAWCAGIEGGQNLGLRLQAMVGIDVDAHDGERGAETLAKAEAELGPLPPTYSSTSRGPGPSRILFYRVPLSREPMLARREKVLVDTYGPNVEILHRTHRFAVVWPSVHPDTGQTYQWYGPDGQVCMVPRRSEIPELPATWLDFLAPEHATVSALEEAAAVTPVLPAAAPGGLGGGSLFATPAQMAAVNPTINLRTPAEAARILGEAYRAFVAPDADGRATRWLPRLALVAGHGIPGGFWTEQQAREGIEAAALACGYTKKHGLADVRVQTERGLRDGAAAPWVMQAEEESSPFDAARVEAGQGRLRRALLKRSEINSLPDPMPLIDGVIFRSSVVVISGKFGTYKSFVAVSMAASLATGRPWFGHEVLGRVPVIYAAAEGAYGIKRRLAAWESAHGVIGDDLYLIPVSVRINRPEDMAELEELIRETGAGVIIFDTMHASTPGVDENDAGEMGHVMDVLRGLQERHGICAILPHHTGHAGERARGSSSVEDDADTTFVIKLAGEDRGPASVRTLVHRKTKDGPLLDDVELELVLVDGTGSGYVRPRGDSFTPAEERKRMEPGQGEQIPDVPEWVRTLDSHGRHDVRRYILTALIAAGTTGRTQAEVQRAVRSKWFGGRPIDPTGKRKGYLSEETWGTAWPAVLAMQWRGEPVVRPGDVGGYGLNPDVVSALTEKESRSDSA